MYLGDGGGEIRFPLYVDGSSELAMTSKCCVAFMVGAVPKGGDVTTRDVTTVVATSEEPPTNKQKGSDKVIVKQKPNIQFWWNVGFKYQLKCIVR